MLVKITSIPSLDSYIKNYAFDTSCSTIQYKQTVYIHVGLQSKTETIPVRIQGKDAG